jgi:hypothetical protein
VRITDRREGVLTHRRTTNFLLLWVVLDDLCNQLLCLVLSLSLSNVKFMDQTFQLLASLSVYIQKTKREIKLVFKKCEILGFLLFSILFQNSYDLLIMLAHEICMEEHNWEGSAGLNHLTVSNMVFLTANNPCFSVHWNDTQRSFWCDSWVEWVFNYSLGKDPILFLHARVRFWVIFWYIGLHCLFLSLFLTTTSSVVWYICDSFTVDVGSYCIGPCCIW